MSLAFNPKNPEAVIECIACKQPLWKIEVRSKFSHAIKAFDNQSRPWSEKDPQCPKCGDKFFGFLDNGNPEYKIRSTKNGEQFTL